MKNYQNRALKVCKKEFFAFSGGKTSIGRSTQYASRLLAHWIDFFTFKHHLNLFSKKLQKLLTVEKKCVDFLPIVEYISISLKANRRPLRGRFFGKLLRKMNVSSICTAMSSNSATRSKSSPSPQLQNSFPNGTIQTLICGDLA